MRRLDERRDAGSVGARHRGARDGHVQVAGRTVVGRRLVRHRGRSCEHLDAGRRDVRLDPVADRSARRERCHLVRKSRLRGALCPRRHHVGVAVDEGEQVVVGTIDVDRRQIVVVGLDVLIDGVVQDHAGRTTGEDAAALVDPAVDAALAHHDLARGRARGERRLAKHVLTRQRCGHDDGGRRRDADGEGDPRDVERGAAVGGQVQGGAELARAGRRADRGDPRAAVIRRPGTGPAVPGGCVNGDAGVGRVEERELDRVAVRVCAARDREVDDVDAVEDRLLDSGDRIGREAASRQADAIFDHACAGGDATDGAALDAVEDGRGDAVTGGGRGRVRAVTLGVTRRADMGRVIAELLAVGAVVGQVRRGECVRADELVVAAECRPEMGDVPAGRERAAATEATGRGAEGSWGEHRVLGPDARVDVAHDDVAACVGGSTERWPDRCRADERGVVVEGVLQGVLLDGSDPVGPEEAVDLVRRHYCLDAAERRRVGRANPQPGRGLLRALRELGREVGGVLVVRPDRGGVVVERLSGDPGAGRVESRLAAGVGGRDVIVILDHDADRGRVRPSEERRIALGDRARDGLGTDERGFRGQRGR